jgi:hypothetical protein
VRLAQTVSLDRDFMKELLMLNNALMEYSVHFSLIWHLQKKDSVILCKTVLLHTQLRKFSEYYAVLGEFNGEFRIISNGFWSPRSTYLNTCDFLFLWGKL